MPADMPAGGLPHLRNRRHHGRTLRISAGCLGLLVIAWAGTLLLAGCQTADSSTGSGETGQPPKTAAAPPSSTEAPEETEETREPPPETTRRPPWAGQAESFLDGFRREILQHHWTAAAQRAVPSLQEELLEESGMAPRDLCLMLLGPGADAPGEEPSVLPSKPLEMEKITRIEYRNTAYPSDGTAVTAGQLTFSNLTNPVPCRIHLTYQEKSLYLTFPGWGTGSTERSAP